MKQRSFLTAEWRSLLMINYEIDPQILDPYVPAGIEPDTWNGKSYVSMVGFLFCHTKVLNLPVPFHRNFEEVNLRFYVRRKAEGKTRRGVVFIKEIVPRRAIAFVARTLYGENYVALPMKHDMNGDTLLYEWRFAKRRHHMSARASGEYSLPAPGSEEEFIAEHYWGYSAQKGRGCVEYRVEHPPWRVRRAEQPHLDCDVPLMYGAEFKPALSSKPTSAFIAEGSPVTVYQGIRI